MSRALAAISAPLLGAAGVAAASLLTKNIGRVQMLAPTTEFNKKLVRRLYHEVWNEKDLTKIPKAIHELIGQDHIIVDPSQPHPDAGCHAYIEMVSNFRTAMPDFKIQIDMLIAEGSRVVASLTYSSGTVPNSTKQAKWTATAILEFAGGQCVRSWVNSDSLSALIQFELVPDVASGPFRRMSSGPAKMLFPEEKMELVDALIGREEQHPETVLTGKDWFEYFQVQADLATCSDSEALMASASPTGKKKTLAKMRVDSKTGLDICI